MDLFSRRRKQVSDTPATAAQDAAESGASAKAVQSGDSAASAPPGDGAAGANPARGPRDISLTSAAEREDLVDLGALYVPNVEGLQVRIDVDAATRQPVSTTLTLGENAVQLQLFAAPKSRGIWDEVRAARQELAEQQHGTYEEQHGQFGTEIVIQLPVSTPAGQGIRPLRFVGVEGPRWLLQALFFGPAALNPSAAAPLEKLLHGVVVDRGQSPLPPKAVVNLTIPGATSATPAAGPQLSMPERGPEIQETR
ncbi:MAG: DUF3710 domain-containing protein [Bowdeniella nasicola]|nr:DUF3710 domain-containing protein [Bowdeniella nasicola]